MEDPSLGYSSMGLGPNFAMADDKIGANDNRAFETTKMTEMDRSSGPQELCSHVKTEPSVQEMPQQSKRYRWCSLIVCVCTVCVHAFLTMPTIPGYGYHDETRIMLLGKTGSGKSTSGNTILGKDVFRHEASPVAVTKHCQTQNGRRNITVIDTPGVTETLWPSTGFGNDSNCINRLVHGVHVFLLVIPLGRFTEEERDMVRWVRTNLGEEGLKFSIVLFTGGDQLEGKPMEVFLNESAELQSVSQSCAGRYHVFNNRERQDESQVTELLEKIEELLSENKGLTYTYEIHAQVQEQRKREEAELLKEEERKCEERETEIRAEEERKRLEEKRRVREVEKERREMKVRDVKDEEEWKRGKMERKIRSDERKRREGKSWRFFFLF